MTAPAATSFRAGVAAAAKVADQKLHSATLHNIAAGGGDFHLGKVEAASEIVDAIRALPVPSGPEPTPFAVHETIRLAAELDQRAVEIRRLRRDLAEAYQAVGAMLDALHVEVGGARASWNGPVVKLLDNLSAGAEGRPRPHDDLLPFVLELPPTEVERQRRLISKWLRAEAPASSARLAMLWAADAIDRGDYLRGEQDV